MTTTQITRRILTSALTAVAFWNSYTHTAAWFTEHGQAAQAPLLALIPEAGVILVVLTLAGGGLTTVVRWLIGAIGIGAVAITFTANLAGASAGAMGIAAALVAPVFAILGFALEVVSIEAPAEAPSEAPAESPAAASAEAPAPAAKPARKVTPARRGNRGLTDTGILWATQVHATGAEWPTTAQILAQFPTISRTTAGRIRGAKPVAV
jgi:hypothetical protein